MATSLGGNDRPFQFKVGGCNGNGGGAGQNQVTMAPPMCTAKDGSQYVELTDPNKEVFILRIAKKSEGANKNNNLELGLCTPKRPELKPPPQKCDRDTEIDPALFGEKGGKKGGKGGKGGKKGKK